MSGQAAYRASIAARPALDASGRLTAEFPRIRNREPQLPARRRCESRRGSEQSLHERAAPAWQPDDRTRDVEALVVHVRMPFDVVDQAQPICQEPISPWTGGSCSDFSAPSELTSSTRWPSGSRTTGPRVLEAGGLTRLVRQGVDVNPCSRAGPRKRVGIHASSSGVDPLSGAFDSG